LSKLRVLSTWMPAVWSPLKGVFVSGHPAAAAYRRRLVVHDGRVIAAGRDDERLDAEAPDEALAPVPGVVGLDVALVPGQAKGRVWNLDDEEVELRSCGCDLALLPAMN
jgi:hypothetical protein